jgi:hypothetical protein
MNLYSIQEQEFEGDSADEALNMAKVYFSNLIQYRLLAGMIFSTPQLKISGIESPSVSIGGSAKGTTIVTGNGNVVSQRGKFDINIPSNIGVHIGDILS